MTSPSGSRRLQPWTYTSHQPSPPFSSTRSRPGVSHLSSASMELYVETERPGHRATLWYSSDQSPTEVLRKSPEVFLAKPYTPPGSPMYCNDTHRKDFSSSITRSEMVHSPYTPPTTPYRPDRLNGLNESSTSNSSSEEGIPLAPSPVMCKPHNNSLGAKPSINNPPVPSHKYISIGEEISEPYDIERTYSTRSRTSTGSVSPALGSPVLTARAVLIRREDSVRKNSAPVFASDLDPVRSVPDVVWKAYSRSVSMDDIPERINGIQNDRYVLDRVDESLENEKSMSIDNMDRFANSEHTEKENGSPLSSPASPTAALFSPIPFRSNGTQVMSKVHPMPSEERNSVRGDMKREKPAVPAKPKGLILDHMNRSTSLTSLCSSPITQTTSTFLNNLVNSSSFISLQQAYGQEMGSQEFQKLEEKRNESISAVSQRLSSFECSRGELEDVLRGHQRTGEQIMAIVEQADHQLAAKVRNQMHNSDELLRLETKLHHQMEKLNEHLRLGGVQQDQAKLEESRLRRRVGDVALLKQTYMRRERALEQQMGVMLSPEQQQQWRMHRELAAQLIKNTKQVDDQIEDSRVHLKALQNTKPFAT